MFEIILRIGVPLYYIFGVVILLANMDGVRALPWNKDRYLQSFLKTVLVDALESVFWPYTLWRVHKLRRNN